MRCIVGAVAALACVLGVAGTAVADGAADLARCKQEVFGGRKQIGDKIAGSFDLALHYCTRAIESGELSDHDLSLGFRLRGVAYKSDGQYDRAIADYDQALRLDAGSAPAYGARGNAYESKGEHDRAIADYDQAVRLDPDYASAYNGRGNAYESKGEHDRAIADYDQAIRLDPADGAVYKSRGRAHFNAGHFAAAADDLAAAAQKNPADMYLALWRYLAEARAGRDAIGGLRAAAAKLTSTDWPQPIVRMMLGEIEPGDAGDAANDADPKRQNEKWCEAQFYIGEWLHIADSGRLQDTVTALRKAVEICPKGFVEYAGALAELQRLAVGSR